MATIDFTISDAEYNQMMTVLDAMRSKLAGLKEPLTRVVASNRTRVKQIANTDDGRFLREVYLICTQLNDYFGDIGWDG